MQDVQECQIVEHALIQPPAETEQGILPEEIQSNEGITTKAVA
jgi:hypothetical protein